ncbi:NTP transferase domain-containing protein [Rhodopseudomonas palustris]|nr:NTP transferase domain-containing protein [Rhodopseudomonas palustris]
MSAFDDISVVVLAGGRGTRLQGLFPEIPKPMVPVAGRPFLHWLTLWLARHGPRHFVYSTGYRAEQIEAWAADDSLPDITRICRREETPLGTGGGLLNCLELCRPWILVANGDGLVMKGIADLLALRGRPDCDGGLLGVEMADTSRYGSLTVSDNGRLTGFQEKMPGRGIINGGVYLLRTELLRNSGWSGACSIELDLFPDLIRRSARLNVIPVSGAPFIDIGTPETVRDATRFVKTYLLL